MISKIRDSVSAGRRETRIAARFALATVAAVLSVGLLLGGASLGSASVAFLQPSPSGSGSAPGGGGSEEPSIAFLNPSVLYEDHTPDVSDKSDTVDTDYHVVAWTNGLVEDPIIEATILPLIVPPGGSDPIPVGNEQTVGTLDPVPGSPDTWELFWDIPSTVPPGRAIMTVRLFEETALGVEEVANDEVEVTVDSSAFGGQSETVELTWPSQNGPIGFYKPRGGSFRSYLDYRTSHADSELGVITAFFVTTSDPGSVPQWASCAGGGLGGTGATCTLSGRTLGSQITALAGEARNCVDPVFSPCFQFEPDASDAHRVDPYFVDPHEMTLDIEFRTTTDSPRLGRQFAGERAPAGSGGSENQKCIAIQAVVRDRLDREVLGANLDWHITGPNDQVQFGQEQPLGIIGNSSSGYKPADKGGHATEVGRNCDPEADEPDDPRTQGEQADHNVPVRDDIKHRESVNGSALDGGSGIPRGGYFVDIYSPNVGLTEVTAWIDNERVPDDSVNPEADDDLIEPGEPSDSVIAQWLPTEATILADPAGGSGPAGTCNKYTLKLRAGTTPVRDLNVDVHATGPTDELDFCDPLDGAIRQAPNTAAAAHDGEDEKESSHPGSSPRVQHTEGEADDAGNFVFGIVSPVAGDATLTAWIDGTKGNNDDAQGTAPAEPAVTFSHSFASSTGDAEVSFVSPSGFGGDGSGGGDEISNKDDGAPGYHVVTRVDAPAVIEGIEVLLAPSGSTTFSSLGQASRIGNSDTYELTWAADVADGDYIMRARILGTNTIEDRTVTVNNQTAATDQPGNRQAETARIANPAAAAGASFRDRAVTIDGTASAGAEGVDLFYTKAPAKDTVASSAWISCGYADLAGSGTTVQNFSGTCSLTGSDQPGQVTGVAAITFDCNQDGGNATPPSGPTAPPRCPGARDSGDAHRVFGFEAAPIVSVEPAETASAVGQCQKMVMRVTDQTGQAIGDVNVDVHARGPADNIDFCDPVDGTGHARGAPNEGGHEVAAGQEDQGYHDEASGPDTSHIEGTNNSAGRYVFGLASDVAGDTQLSAWLDRSDNEILDGDEGSDTAIIHWEEEAQPGGCDIEGTDGPDTLTGTGESERICSFGGDDEINGGGGDDVIVGGPGDDRLRGNAGNDIIRGGGGHDRVSGGGGRDRGNGGSGNDLVKGQRGFDRLSGHSGRDTLDGGLGRDSCFGGRGRDRLRNCEATRSGFSQGYARRIESI